MRHHQVVHPKSLVFLLQACIVIKLVYIFHQADSNIGQW
jgi:hypothetical protein